MCYKPLHLVNNSLNFDPSQDPISRTVPCGKCGECLTNKKMDWRVRAYYHHKMVSDHGGFCLFVTLTYNNAHLPKKYKLPCFRKSDIQDYLKSFRNHVCRKIDKELSTKISYIVTCEYGSDPNYSHRPHYHMLVFFDDPRFNVNQMKYYLKKCWPNGYIKFGCENGGLVNSDHAIRYVTKYITKDMDFEETFKDKFDHDDIEIMKSSKKFYPFHLQSKGFGLYALECTDFETLELGQIPIPDKNQIKMVKLPLFLDRKLFYDVVPNPVNGSPSYQLNDKGFEMKSKRYDKLVESIEQKIKEVRNNHNQHYIWNPEVLNIINSVCADRFANQSQFEIELLYSINRYTDREVAEYIVSKRDMWFISDSHDSKEMYLSRYVSKDSKPCCLTVETDYLHECMNKTYNCQRKYRNLETFIKLYNAYVYAIGLMRSRLYNLQYQTIKEQKISNKFFY